MENNIQGNKNNIAGRDINITIINPKEELPRNKLVSDIVELRKLSNSIKSLMDCYAFKVCQTNYYKDLPDNQLKEMHTYAMKIKDVISEQNRPTFIQWLLSVLGKNKK